jgi:hypothetical protein
MITKRRNRLLNDAAVSLKLIQLINQRISLSQSKVTLTSLPLNLALSIVFTAAVAESLVSNPTEPLPFDLP